MSACSHPYQAFYHNGSWRDSYRVVHVSLLVSILVKGAGLKACSYLNYAILVNLIYKCHASSGDTTVSTA